MAFDGTKFARASAHNNADVPHIWCYATAADDDATVQGSGYFNAKRLELGVGDAIWTYTTDGTAILEVATNDGTTVTTGLVDADA